MNSPNAANLYGKELQLKVIEIFRNNYFKYKPECCGETDLLAYQDNAQDSRAIYLVECKGCESGRKLILDDLEDTKNWSSEWRGIFGQFGNYIPLQELRYDLEKQTFYDNYITLDAMSGSIALALSMNHDAPAFSRCCSKGDFFNGAKKEDGFYKGIQQLIKACASDRLKAEIDSIAEMHKDLLPPTSPHILPTKIIPLIVVPSEIVIQYADGRDKGEKNNVKWAVYDVKDRKLYEENKAAIKYVFVVGYDYLNEFIRASSICHR